MREFKISNEYLVVELEGTPQNSSIVVSFANTKASKKKKNPEGSMISSALLPKLKGKIIYTVGVRLEVQVTHGVALGAAPPHRRRPDSPLTPKK